MRIKRPLFWVLTALPVVCVTIRADGACTDDASINSFPTHNHAGFFSPSTNLDQMIYNVDGGINGFLSPYCHEEPDESGRKCNWKLPEIGTMELKSEGLLFSDGTGAEVGKVWETKVDGNVAARYICSKDTQQGKGHLQSPCPKNELGRLSPVETFEQLICALDGLKTVKANVCKKGRKAISREECRKRASLPLVWYGLDGCYRIIKRGGKSMMECGKWLDKHACHRDVFDFECYGWWDEKTDTCHLEKKIKATETKCKDTRVAWWDETNKLCYVTRASRKIKQCKLPSCSQCAEVEIFVPNSAATDVTATPSSVAN